MSARPAEQRPKSLIKSKGKITRPQVDRPKAHFVLFIEDLPLLPNRLLGKHWRLRHTEKDKWLLLIGCQVFAENVKPLQPFERAALKLTRHSAKEPDFDGLVGSFKYVVDALVARGVLAGDTPSQIEPTYEWKHAHQGKGRISVEVIEQ